MKTNIQEIAKKIRLTIIEAAHNAGNQGVHIGGALSMADILAVIYSEFNTTDYSCADRNRVVLSKGHDCLGLYAALNVCGVISNEELRDNFLQDGGFLPTHPVKNIPKGIECSSGSLGQGLSFAVGLALSSKLKHNKSYTFVIVGDGECDEGSCWEAMMSAKQFELNNIIMFVDKNGFQSDGPVKDIMSVDLDSAIVAMGWNVMVVDGHDVKEIYDAIKKAMSNNNSSPTAIVARTIKGKGVSFMENDNRWHHGHLTEDLYIKALQDLQ